MLHPDAAHRLVLRCSLCSAKRPGLVRPPQGVRPASRGPWRLAEEQDVGLVIMAHTITPRSPAVARTAVSNQAPGSTASAMRVTESDAGSHLHGLRSTPPPRRDGRRGSVPTARNRGASSLTAAPTRRSAPGDSIPFLQCVGQCRRSQHCRSGDAGPLPVEQRLEQRIACTAQRADAT
jgi:hypothetical protein